VAERPQPLGGAVAAGRVERRRQHEGEPPESVGLVAQDAQQRPAAEREPDAAVAPTWSATVRMSSARTS
jgi:hypothetical protein